MDRPDRTVAVSALKARLSEHLRTVREGATLVVTDRGIAIARLEPLAASGALRARTRTQIEAGVLRAPRAAPDPDFWTWFWAQPRSEAPDGQLVEAALDERASGW